MISRGQVTKALNAVFNIVDALQDDLPKQLVRPHERLNVIRDQLALLAIDLGLPIQPIEQKAPDTRPEVPQTE